MKHRIFVAICLVMVAFSYGGPVLGRTLDSATGRFLTPDPIGFAGGTTNLYEADYNNPLSFVDPTGLAACSYSISTHSLTCQSDLPNGPNYGSSNVVSGNGPFADDPSNVPITNLGPLPPGNYIISPGKPGTFPNFALSPVGHSGGYGRGGFEIHGCANTATCSQGCVGVYGNANLHGLSDLLTTDSALGYQNTLTVTP